MIENWSAADQTNFAKFTLGVSNGVCLVFMVGIVISLLSADIISNNSFAAIWAISLQRPFDDVRFSTGSA